MRFLHLSDLHIGKKLNGLSLIEDQRYILAQILDIIDGHNPHAVIVAGDIYDSSIPPAEAVMLLDWFFTRVLEASKMLFVISGNHDSAERLSFGGKIMKTSGLFIEGVYGGAPACVTLSDEYGALHVHMLPFIKPAHVNALHGEDFETYNGAVRYAVSQAQINPCERNILISHQFVTSPIAVPELSDSEMKYAGGLDNVDYSVFSQFDYVALGHLHCPQKAGLDTIMYSGSPLKYSISERFQPKCAIIVDVLEKGNVTVSRLPLAPLRELRQVRGTLSELLNEPETDDYISIILTDTERFLEPHKRLRTVYRNFISIVYESDRALDSDFNSAVPDEIGSPAEVFERFYFERNGVPLDDSSAAYIRRVVDEITGGEDI